MRVESQRPASHGKLRLRKEWISDSENMFEIMEQIREVVNETPGGGTLKLILKGLDRPGDKLEHFSS
jgi:hypothetical protein